jgi:hypothetical protein
VLPDWNLGHFFLHEITGALAGFAFEQNGGISG